MLYQNNGCHQVFACLLLKYKNKLQLLVNRSIFLFVQYKKNLCGHLSFFQNLYNRAGEQGWGGQLKSLET